MSIVRLRKSFRRKMKLGVGKYKVGASPMDIIFWVIVIIFVVGAYYTFGAPTGGRGGPDDQAGVPRKVTKNVAVANGHVISRLEYEREFMRRAAEIPREQLLINERYVKTSVLDSMIQRLLLLDAAKQSGIRVSGADVDAKVDQLVQQSLDRSYPTRKALAKFLRKRGQTLEQYKREVRKERMQDRDAIKEAVLFEKLEEKIKSAVKVGDADLKDHYTKIKARQILINPDELKRLDEAKKEAEKAEQDAKDDKDTQADKTADEKPAKDSKARKLAKSIRDRVKKGENFEDLAMEYSHDTRTAFEGGLLRTYAPPNPAEEPDPEATAYFARGELSMPAEFDDAAFALKPNQTSDVVETPYGLYVIQVLDRKVQYPEDYKDNKDDYRDQLLEQKKTEAWTDYNKKLSEQADTRVDDSELAAYRLLAEDKKAEAAQLLAKAAENDPRNVGAKYQLANLLQDSADKSKAIELLTELAESEQAASSAVLHLQLADLLAEEKLTERAIQQYEAASEWSDTYDYQSMYMHDQLKRKFEQLERKDLAEKEQKWIDEFNEYQAEQNAGTGYGGP